MALSSFQPKRKPVKNGEEVLFSVRALALSDIASIIEHDLPSLDVMFEKIAKENPNIFTDGASDTNLIVNFVKDAPQIAARAVALAADEPDAVENARVLPVPVLLEALTSIFELTFTDYGGPKKFVETVMSLFMQGKGALMKNTVSNPSGKTRKRPRP
jgi:hypothetical protein